MIGHISVNLYDEDIAEEVARKKMFEVSDRYGLDFEDVDLSFDRSLPYNVLGKTTARRDGVEISVGDTFLRSSEYEQLKTMLHEGIHVKQFRDETTDWLDSNFDTSDRFLREVERSSDPRYTDDIEGITEVLTENLLPFETSSGYPYQQRRKEAELSAKGIDVESELVESVDEELGLDDYADIYNSVDADTSYSGDSIYSDWKSFASSFSSLFGEVQDYLEKLPEIDWSNDNSSDYRPAF